MIKTSELTFIGPVLMEALGANSPIVQSVQAGKIPAVHVIVDQLLAGQGQEHLDHKIPTIAAVYLVLGDLLLKTDLKLSPAEKRKRLNNLQDRRNRFFLQFAREIPTDIQRERGFAIPSGKP